MAKSRFSVKGMIAARKAFQALPEETRAALWTATEETADVTAYEARMRLRHGHGIRTGALQRAIGVSKSARSGFAKVGLKREVLVVTLPDGRQVRHRPSAIGHLVEFGTSARVQEKTGRRTGAGRPFPFMKPAAESQRVPYATRLKRAGKDLERTMSSRYL